MFGLLLIKPHLAILVPFVLLLRAQWTALLSGAVTVWVGDDETHQLTDAGDALTFPSTLPHRWRNDARGESRLLWINTPPTF